MKNALKLGGILGFISLVLTAAIPYVIGFDKIFSSTWFMVSSLIYLIVLTILGIKMFRPADSSQPLAYGEALKYLFVAMFVGSVIGIVGGTLLLGNNEEAKVAFEKYIESSRKTGMELGMSMTGKTDEEIEIELEKMQDKIDSGELEVPEADYPYSFSMLPMNILSSGIMSLIYALITGIFVRRKEKGIITEV